jgi:hypothetical protein
LNVTFGKLSIFWNFTFQTWKFAKNSKIQTSNVKIAEISKFGFKKLPNVKFEKSPNFKSKTLPNFRFKNLLNFRFEKSHSRQKHHSGCFQNWTTEKHQISYLKNWLMSNFKNHRISNLKHCRILDLKICWISDLKNPTTGKITSQGAFRIELRKTTFLKAHGKKPVHLVGFWLFAKAPKKPNQTHP